MLINRTITGTAVWQQIAENRTTGQGKRRRIIFRAKSDNAGPVILTQDPSAALTSGLYLYAGDVYLDEVDNLGYMWQEDWFAVGNGYTLYVSEETV